MKLTIGRTSQLETNHIHKELAVKSRKKREGDKCKEYVLGFAFAPNGDCLFIEKNSGWQSGLVNGIGGKRNQGESLRATMIREFKEETGLDTQEWEYGLTLYGKNDEYDWELSLFRLKMDNHPQILNPEIDEGFVFWSHVLPENIEQTARWMYYYCKDDSTFGNTLRSC